MNNDIIPGFDDDKKTDLQISLSIIDNDIMVISLYGQIDTYNSQWFSEKIKSLIYRGYHKILFMLGGVQYMSSTGIGAFTTLLKEMKNRNGSFVLVNIKPTVHEIFELLGFSNFFSFASNTEEAVGLLFEKPKEKTSMFPVIFNCPSCDTKLKASKSGRFRCSKCKIIIEIDKEGHVRF